MNGTKRKQGTKRNRDAFESGVSQIAIVNDPKQFYDWLKATANEPYSHYSYWQNRYKFSNNKNDIDVFYDILTTNYPNHPFRNELINQWSQTGSGKEGGTRRKKSLKSRKVKRNI